MKLRRKIKCVVKYLVASSAAGLLSAVALAQEADDIGLKAEMHAGSGGALIVEAHGVPPKPPLFFSTKSEQLVRVNSTSVRQKISLSFKKLQGADEVMSLAIRHKSDIKSVIGEGLKEWSVREHEGVHYLDVRANDADIEDLDVDVHAELKLDKSIAKPHVHLMTFSNVEGDRAGFSESITILKDGVQVDVLEARGCTVAKSEVADSMVFISHGSSDMELRILKSAGDYAPIDLRDIEVQAVVDDSGKSARVTLSGELHVREASEVPFTLLRGKVALSSFPDIDAGKMHVSHGKSGMVYGIVCSNEGVYSVQLDFAVPVTSGKGWSELNFTVPNGAVVPLAIDNLKESIEFRRDETTVLDFNSDGSSWHGVLPATGVCDLSWKTRAKTGDGALFYTTEGVTEVSVSSGLMHASSKVQFKVLQGKMSKVVFDLSGSGEIVSVLGSQVASWKVSEVGGKKLLECVMKAAISGVSELRVASQHALGKFPAKVEPLTLTPRGSMRHSGFIRVSNRGAVRVETSLTRGLMQLSPDKFPVKQAQIKGVGSQVFVYRFPSAERKIELSADQITSEVSLSHITTYEMSETDRVIDANIEIDIAEAGLREWSFMIPADYSVSRVVSANMADHVVSTTVVGGRRAVKILFNGEVIGRQLILVRLEKNLAAAGGEWSLPVMAFPGVKTIRGDIGVLSASGWKMIPVKASVKQLDERPLAYFPGGGDRLQHAYRTRSAEWSATVQISAMGQSIQSDLLHLYHLKEGVLEAKILAYYFVIGAPTNEWKLSLPAGVENVSVEGQYVRTWDQDGDVLTVTLNQPVMGTSKLLVTYEEPMSPRGGTISIGSVTPIGVHSESGFIHLVSDHQVKVSDVKKSGSLLRISPLEMPSEHQVLTSTPSVAAWQYSARPYGVSLHVETMELVKTLDQAVGAASLDTRITSEGEVVTNAKFLVNTRGSKALRIKLPEGNKLWTSMVDGELINARVDGDQVILPLPSTKDANRYRTLEIRYGGISDDPAKVTVGPPVLSAPLTIAEWKVTGDNHMSAIGGNVKPLQMHVSENGFSQIKSYYYMFIGVLGLLLGGVFLLRDKITDRWLILFGNVWVLAAIAVSILLGVESVDTTVTSFKEFDVVAPVVSHQEAVSLELSNEASGPSRFSGIGISLLLVGVGLLVVSMLDSDAVRNLLPTTLLRGLAVFAILVSCLMHVGGAAYFYFALALLAGLLLVKGLPKLINGWNFKSGGATAVSVVLFSMMALVSESRADEQIADSIVEAWDVRDKKLISTQTITWNAEEGDSLEILRAPGVLLGAEGDGFRVVKMKSEVDGSLAWRLVAEDSGEIRAVVRYQVMLKGEAELMCRVLSGKSAMKTLSVVVDEANWKVSSAQSVRSERLDGADEQSSFHLTLMGLVQARVILRPMPRDRSVEKLRFLAEVADVYVPAPGVLDGRHKVSIKPLAGELKEVAITIPDGLMVGNVMGSEIDNWRFDAASKTLTVMMQRPQTKDFNLMIMTQRGVKAYPQDLLLESILVRGAASTVGEIGYGFGLDSQPDDAKVVDLLEINIADFDKSLVKSARDLQSKFLLHKAYRYGQKRGKINLRVAAVAPEIRVKSQQTIRLSDERISHQVEAFVHITRAGVFELKFMVPSGLSVESINGAALRDWSLSEVGGKSLATMYLNGKTMGNQRFIITMQGDAPEVATAASVWDVPRWSLEGVDRQGGVLSLIPDHGIRLRVADRKHASELENKDSAVKSVGSLGFRLLQRDWKISLAVQKLDPWITAEILQQVSVREGLTKHWMNIHYQVEHAVVKKFNIRIPGVGKEQASTLRASGKAVKEIVHVKADEWQINLRRGMIGSVPVQIGYQDLTLRGGDEELISPVHLLDSKQAVHYVAVRVPSRLEVQGAELREWRGFDWANVPSKLYDVSDRSDPSLCYRVLDAKKKMALSVKRHSMAGTLKLRVARGNLRTMFNADGGALSRLSLDVNVAEKSSLRISLPDGAELFNVIVNDKSAEVVKEGDAYWFHVSESNKDKEPAKVQITYQVKAGAAVGKVVTLLGPKMSIPLENIDWYVMLPDGYSMGKYRGGFDYIDTIRNPHMGSYTDAFKSIKKARYMELREEGQRELDRAMDFSNRGQLDKANAALNRVFRNQAVDAASNEDARVKLERNMTSQAIMGLNTRSQKSYMDNKAMGNTQGKNDALEEAVTRNPFFLGSKNFDPNQLGDYMQGNSAEEILAMKRIARKLVKPQLVTSSAGQAVELEILDTRNVLHFRKDLHLAGDHGLGIEIELNSSSVNEAMDVGAGGSHFGLILILFITSFIGIWLSRK